MDNRCSRAALAAIFLLWAASASAGREARLVLSLDSGWRFSRTPSLSGVEAVAFDDAGWTAVDVPHTWNRLGNQGTERSPLSNGVQGVGWYRLHFKAPSGGAGSRYFLQFDAVGAIADVWLNGRFLGRHAGAFSRFRFDASAFVKASGDNVLVVKADNSPPQPGSATENVIPLSGDFFVFGGIYRNVSLIVTGPLHVDLLDFGGPGLYARTLELSAAAATVQLSGRIANDLGGRRRAVVEFAIEDAQGATVASTFLETNAAAGPSAVEARLHVRQPRLWQGVKDPYLYRSVLILRSQSGAVLDRIEQPLGFRSARFDADQGFFLNGEHVFLKGASMHQDRPVKGWAVSRADHAEDFDLLQDLGANAVRLAHYPHDEYSYELADERGIVAWAEIPLVNKASFDGSPANEALAANARQQLTELIRQNYNHPSIVLWSLGNEMDLTATQIKGPSRVSALLRSLNELAKREDPSRATTFADCCEAGIAPQAGSAQAGVASRDAIVGMADTVGYNRYFGWYAGRMADLGPMLDGAHARHPGLPIGVSEYGAGAALTQHSDDPQGGLINPHGRPHPEEYQDWYHEQSWTQLESRGYLWGVYIWNLFDFASDSRGEGDLTDINEKGLVSYDRRTRKDAYYFYRANWNAEPTLHLVGRRHVDRAYAVTDVRAYSNALEARLSVNGRDIGSAPCAEGICIWRSVHLDQGANELTATAVAGGRAVADSLRWSLSHSERIVNIKAGDISGHACRDGQVYGSDMYFYGGTGRGVNPPDTAPAGRAAVLADEPRIYDSFREGEFLYRIPLPNGRYRVLLKFEEPEALAVGDRRFDVVANEATLLEDFDILKAAGARLKGVDRAFDVRVDHGLLVLSFRPRRGSALVSALSIAPLVRRRAAAGSIAAIEETYADAIDASGVLTTIDSGLIAGYQDQDRAAWESRYRGSRGRLAAALHAAPAEGLSPRDAHALSRMRAGLASTLPENPYASAGNLASSPGTCADASRKDLDAAALRGALYACFDELGNRLHFEGRLVPRDSALALLSQIEDAERRKALFFAFRPLWEAVNGHDQNDSPYRRRLKFAAAAAAARGSRIDAAAQVIGQNAVVVEHWLEQVLDAWRQVLPDRPVEPWDYRFFGGEADRILAEAAPAGRLLTVNKRYYHDLGADLDGLGVLFDLEPRPGKSPLSYTSYVTMGRQIGPAWRPTVPRVSGSFTESGLYVLNMLAHENGHAVHYGAIRNTPAFMDIGADDLFCESFADVTSWNVYDADWQRRYLGHAASEAAGLRSQYTMVTLEVAWGLFEARMLRHPDADPNAVWTDITGRYLHIVPHPELSWWAQRVQLVSEPGFMANYGLGAILTAEMRAQIRQAIGPFNAGNPRWYPWVSRHLLRHGTERTTARLLKDLLGRPVSPEALIEDIRRLAPARQ